MHSFAGISLTYFYNKIYLFMMASRIASSEGRDISTNIYPAIWLTMGWYTHPQSKKGKLQFFPLLQNRYTIIIHVTIHVVTVIVII